MLFGLDVPSVLIGIVLGLWLSIAVTAAGERYRRGRP